MVCIPGDSHAAPVHRVRRTAPADRAKIRRERIAGQLRSRRGRSRRDQRSHESD